VAMLSLTGGCHALLPLSAAPGDGTGASEATPPVDASGDATRDQTIQDADVKLPAGDAGGEAVRHDLGSGAVAWLKCFGAGANDRAYAVAVDGSDNVYVTGHFANTVDFGGGPRTSTTGGTGDVFVASYTAAGTHRWSSTFGGAGADHGMALAINGSGGVYLAGVHTGDFSVGSESVTLQGASDVLLASLDGVGKVQWLRGYGGPGSDRADGIAADMAGNIYIAGSFSDSVDLGGKSLTSKGLSDAFVASYAAASGTLRWALGFGDLKADAAYAIAVDGSGNSSATGYFQGTTSLGGPPRTAAATDAFVLALDPQGKYRWDATLGGQLYEYGRGVTLDGAGNVYVAGSFAGSGSFAGTQLTASGADVFVASFNAAGGGRWATGFGGASSDVAQAVGLGPAGVVVTGYFGQSVTLGTDTLLDKGGNDVLVAALDGSGAPVRGWALGGGQADSGEAVAVDSTGNIYVAGYLRGTVSFGQAGSCSAVGEDAFLAKIVP